MGSAGYSLDYIFIVFDVIYTRVWSTYHINWSYLVVYLGTLLGPPMTGAVCPPVAGKPTNLSYFQFLSKQQYQIKAKF